MKYLDGSGLQRAWTHIKKYIDDKAATKAETSHTHAQSEIDGLTTALNAKAPKASPTFTGTPKGPTAAAGTNTTQLATTAFVTTAINNLAGDISSVLDEINGEVI